MPDTASPAVIAQLNEVLGDFFAQHLSGDHAWAVGVLGDINEG